MSDDEIFAGFLLSGGYDGDVWLTHPQGDCLWANELTESHFDGLPLDEAIRQARRHIAEHEPEQ